MDVGAKEELYDVLFSIGQQILDHYNPCEWRDERCGRMCSSKSETEVCCEGCKHLGKNGCTVKSLACKLWLCESQSNLFKECSSELKVLRMVADYCGVPNENRQSKDEDFRFLRSRESRQKDY